MPASARAAILAHVATADLGFKTIEPYRGQFRDAARQAAADPAKVNVQLTQLLPAVFALQAESSIARNVSRHEFGLLVVSRDRKRLDAGAEEDALERAEALAAFLLANPTWSAGAGRYSIIEDEGVTVQSFMITPAIAVYLVGVTFDQS